MISNALPSMLRTGVPYGVGWVCAWLLAHGINVPADTRDWAVSGLTFAIGLGYYTLARLLEHKWPQLSWLVGYPAKPTYVKPAKKAAKPANMHADGQPGA